MRSHRIICYAATLVAALAAPALHAETTSSRIARLTPAIQAVDIASFADGAASSAADGGTMVEIELASAESGPAPLSFTSPEMADPQADNPAPSHYGKLRWGGKLRLTNGIATLDGASGGGLAGWAIIAGRETFEGIGASAHITYVELPNYNWESHGIAVGLFDRFELSYARQNLDTIDIGAALGLGRSYVLNQDVFGAKLRLFGDAVYGPPALPQVAVGVQYKHNLDGPVARAVGGRSDKGTDFYVSATKIVLSQSVLLNATLRYTKANQLGLLGFGGDKSNDRSLQFEGSAGYMLSRNFVVGAEYRTKPDNLSVAREDDWLDLFAAWSITDNFTLTAAYVDLGSIATAQKQRGGLLSLQAAF